MDGCYHEVRPGEFAPGGPGAPAPDLAVEVREHTAFSVTAGEASWLVVLEGDGLAVVDPDGDYRDGLTVDKLRGELAVDEDVTKTCSSTCERIRLGRPCDSCLQSITARRRVLTAIEERDDV